MTYKINETKWNSIQWFFDRMWEAPDAFPDQGVLLALSEEEVKELLCEDRIILLKTLLKSGKPNSVSNVSNRLGRSVEAVLQDLEFLQTVSLTEKDEKGNWIANEAIVLPEIELKMRGLGQRELVTV